MPAKSIKNAAVVPCWTTFLGALAGALSAAGSAPVELSEAAGRTGFAFRLNVRDDVDASGPSTYPNAETARRAFDQMGWDVEHIAASPTDNAFAARQRRAVEAIQRGVDRGVAAVAWGITLGEYSLVSGYDSDERRFTVSTVLGAEADSKGLAYGDLGLSAGFLDVMVPRERVETDSAAVAAEALRIGVGHAIGAEAHYAGFANGLAGYGLWIESMREGRAQLFGTAYNVQVYGEARRFAHEYLSGLAADGVLEETETLSDAAGDYGRVADNFSSLGDIVHFHPDLPRQERVAAEAAAEAVELLERALFWERQAVAKLEQVLKSINNRKT